MTDSSATAPRRWSALELAGTIRHDGNGGVADDLEHPAGLTAWVRTRAELLEPAIGGAAIEQFTADEHALSAVVQVRTAVRALLARAVAPAPPSRADAGRLPDAADALAYLNNVASRVPVALGLDWPADRAPTLRITGMLAAPADPVAPSAAVVDQLTSALAREAMMFLADPDSHRLAACSAPRCVRYFLREHGRQEYCKPSCSNRARVARHYQRQRSG